MIWLNKIQIITYADTFCIIFIESNCLSAGGIVNRFNDVTVTLDDQNLKETIIQFFTFYILQWKPVNNVITYNVINLLCNKIDKLTTKCMLMLACNLMALNWTRHFGRLKKYPFTT